MTVRDACNLYLHYPNQAPNRIPPRVCPLVDHRMKLAAFLAALVASAAAQTNYAVGVYTCPVFECKRGRRSTDVSQAAHTGAGPLVNTQQASTYVHGHGAVYNSFVSNIHERVEEHRSRKEAILAQVFHKKPAVSPVMPQQTETRSAEQQQQPAPGPVGKYQQALGY